MDIEKSLLPTSETYFGAILSDTKISQMFETTSVDNDAFNNPDIRFRSIGGNVIVRIVGRIKKGLNYISPSKSSLITSLRVLPIRSA